jgi:choline dehydrogenase-like flavoprotein
MNPSRMFNITSQPNPELNNRAFSVGIGCCVGGSSCVNGQVMLRGTKEEYDAWAELGGGDSDWDWDGLLPYFKKVSCPMLPHRPPWY